MTARRHAILTAVFVGTVALPALAPAPGGGNWDRLRAMPREQRLQLAAQLKRFDTLTRDEQASLRDLDRRIANEPQENRESYLTVLRRYHLWVQSLPEARRNDLRAAPTEKRLALARRIHAEQRERGGETARFFQAADLLGPSPFLVARLIQVWFHLTPQEKAEVSRLPENERGPRINQFGKALKPIAHRPGPAKSQELYDRAVKKYPFMKKAAEAPNPDAFKKRLAEHFSFLDTPPQKVQPDKLLGFDQALPGWVRSGIDSLPPEEARRRLTILYRLVYPDGEMGPAKPAATASKGATPPPPPRPAAVPGKAAPPVPNPY